MKLEELFSSLQSQSTDEPHASANSLNSPASSFAAFSGLANQQGAPPGAAPNLRHVAPQETPLFSRLLDPNNGQPKPTSLDLSQTGQSAHTLLDRLMKSPETTSPSSSHNGPGPTLQAPPPPLSSAGAFPGYFPAQQAAFPLGVPLARPSVPPFPSSLPFQQHPQYHPAMGPFAPGLAPPPHMFPHAHPGAAFGPPPLPTPQQMAYQQYFAYYYNCFRGQAPAHLPPPEAFGGVDFTPESLSSRANVEPNPLPTFAEQLRVSSNPEQPSPIASASPSKKAIRVDVNDLFSLSKTYAETHASLDPNQILRDLIQKQQQQMSGNQAEVSTNSNHNSWSQGKSGQSLSRSSLPKGPPPGYKHGKTVPSPAKEAVPPVGPKELTELNETVCLDLLRRLRRELLTTTQTIPSLILTYDWKSSNCLYTIIKQYFAHLAERLQAEAVSHLNLIDSSQYAYDDFASYGQRFTEFLRECGLFPPAMVQHFTSLLDAYERAYPGELIAFRRKLLDIKMGRSMRQQMKQSESALKSQRSQGNRNSANKENHPEEENAAAANSPVTCQMVTYRQINSKRLHSSICAIKAVREQVPLFLSHICLSPEGEQARNQFLDCLNGALRSSELAEFGPQLHKFGSLCNGLGTYDSDLDIVIKFNAINSDILDYGTSILALEVMELILQDSLGIQAKDTIVPSRRCPILKLNFSVCFPFLKKAMQRELKANATLPPFEFNKCDISLITTYGVHNSRLLHFFTHYDTRFREMTLIFKYWAKKNDLIDTMAFSTYGFTMMIIFYLQNTNPPVLPSIAHLQSLAKTQPGKAEMKVHKYNFQFCDDIDLIGRSTNTQNIQDLLLGFFRFYVKFDFYNYALSPRLGSAVKKIMLRSNKQANALDNFNMASYVCIEDPFVLEHNVGFIFRARNISRWNNFLRSMLYKLNPNNCIKVLVDPGNFNLCKNQGNLIYLPFNLFGYELTTAVHYKQLPVPPSAISLKAVSQQMPFEVSVSSMKKLYLLVLRHLLATYLSVPNSAEALQLEPITEGADGLTCSIDFAYLSHVNFKLDFRTNHKYDALFQTVRKRAPDATKRVPLLKMLRDDLSRPVDPRNLRDRPVNATGSAEPWFKLELASHPPVHQAQIPPQSYQALLAANTEVPIPYLIFRLQVSQNSSKFALASKFADLIQEVLQQFSYTIDRANPQLAFDSLVKEFFND